MVAHVGMGRAEGKDRARGAAGKSSRFQPRSVFHKNPVRGSPALLPVVGCWYQRIRDKLMTAETDNLRFVARRTVPVANYFPRRVWVSVHRAPSVIMY